MATYPYKEIGKRIKLLRAGFAETQEEFAARCEINRGYLAEMEIGRKRPSAKTLSLLIAATEVNSNWLLTGEGEMLFPDSMTWKYEGDGLPKDDPIEFSDACNHAARMMFWDKTGNAVEAALIVGAALEKHRVSLVLAIKKELFLLEKIDEDKKGTEHGDIQNTLSGRAAE